MSWKESVIYRAFHGNLELTAAGFLTVGWLCMSALVAEPSHDGWSTTAACCFAIAVVPLLVTFVTAKDRDMVRRDWLLGALPTVGIVATVVGIACWLMRISPYVMVFFLLSAVASCIILVVNAKSARSMTGQIPPESKD